MHVVGSISFSLMQDVFHLKILVKKKEESTYEFVAL